MSTTPATKALDDMGMKYSLHKYTSTVERDFGLEASLRLNMNPQQVFKTILNSKIAPGSNTAYRKHNYALV